MNWKYKEILEAMRDGNFSNHFKNSLHGIEREGLRVNKKGEMSMAPHPEAFGAALTNPYINTDFSEAQLELITPPFKTEKKTIEFLGEIESYVQKHLKNEFIWSPSMPCILPKKESNIPLAQYGNSDIAKKKTLYREGLGHRYGRRMQTISGMHYNFSFSKDFWKDLKKKFVPEKDLQAFIDEGYMRIMRNFLRMSWLDVYLFGSSPAIDKSYIETSKRPLKKLGKRTYYAEHATSLRMSSFGYCCSTQKELEVSHNSLDEYVKDIKNAVLRPYSGYEEYGEKQINSNYLQTSREYYSPIRAKQKAGLEEDPIEELSRKGIMYLELRSGDLDPFSTCGVDIEQMYFFHILTIYLLTQSAQELSPDEQKNCARNHNKVAIYGRKKGLKLIKKNKEVELKKWGIEEIKNMLAVAQLLDEEHKTSRYSQNLNNQIQKLNDPEKTPSANILSILKKEKIEFIDFGLRRTKENSEFYKITKIPKDVEAKFLKEVKNSFKEKDLLES